MIKIFFDGIKFASFETVLSGCMGNKIKELNPLLVVLIPTNENICNTASNILVANKIVLLQP